ncbi:MAG: phage holin family protein [Solirubrobacteraceae bacterium]|nr:phage holin family protein [Solirubrobacteraceae bacterium]
MAADPRTPYTPPSRGESADIAVAMQQVTDKATLLIREEIELAKAEVTEKLTRIAKSIAIFAAAGVFAIFGLSILLQGFAWLSYEFLPTPEGDFFYGFFFVAFLLFLAGGLAGYGAARIMKTAQPPVPSMAMEEAERIKQTIDEARS